jgi:hypothetical protein
MSCIEKKGIAAMPRSIVLLLAHIYGFKVTEEA